MSFSEAFLNFAISTYKMKNFIEVHVITHENAPTTKVLINVSSIFIVESLFNNAIIGIQMPSSNKKNGFE